LDDEEFIIVLGEVGLAEGDTVERLMEFEYLRLFPSAEVVVNWDEIYASGYNYVASAIGRGIAYFHRFSLFGCRTLLGFLLPFVR
jgi:hypothetical protein